MRRLSIFIVSHQESQYTLNAILFCQKKMAENSFEKKKQQQQQQRVVKSSLLIFLSWLENFTFFAMS